MNQREVTNLIKRIDDDYEWQENMPIHTAVEDGIESPVREPDWSNVSKVPHAYLDRTEDDGPRFALEAEALRFMENWTRGELTVYLNSKFPDLASLIVNSLKDSDLIALVKEARDSQ